MKILFLSGQFFPKIVGSGTMAYLIARELSERGHDVTVIMDEEIRDLSHDVIYPFNVEYIDSFKAFNLGETSFRKATIEIYSIFKNSKYDLVHVYGFMPMLLISIIRTLLNCPVVFTFWNTPHKLERAIGFYENSDLDLQLARFIVEARKYDRIIVGSQCYYNAALYLGANPKLIDFSYIGIDRKEFINNLQNSSKVDLSVYFGNNLKPNDTLITLPGRITPRKGILEAIHALKKVNKVYPSKLLLTGMAEPYSKEFSDIILQQAAKLGIKEKILIPKKVISRDHLPAVYKRSDVVITPSYYEGLGLTAIEALVAARPLVATSVPGLNEITKDGENCLLVPPKDSESLARSILKLLEDKDLSWRLASAGPDSVKKFDIKRFVDHLIKVYNDLAKYKK